MIPGDMDDHRARLFRESILAFNQSKPHSTELGNAVLTAQGEDGHSLYA